MQNDPKLWLDSNKFNPSRFSERETACAKASILADPNDLSRFDFLPFGHGRYSCPGNVFAMNEMLLFLSMMFHNFAMRLVNAVPSPDVTKMVNAAYFRHIQAVLFLSPGSFCFQVGVQHAAPATVCRVFHVLKKEPS